MDPMWTREVKLSQRMLDPLGLSRVSLWITDQLLPGITSVTNTARNYSFYSWAIENLLKTNKIRQRSQFAYHLTKREAAFVIGSILHEEKKAVKLNPHGYDKAVRFMNKASNEMLQVAFNVSDSNSEGFYGLYYRNAMYRLGLTIRSSIFDDLTPLGRRLSSCFESNIGCSEYFKNHVQDDDVEKSVLSEYGDSACICQLAKPSEERDLLRKVMFRENLKSSFLEKSRLETLRMALYLIQKCSTFGIDFTDSVFRDAVFFGQVTDGKSVYDVDLRNFEEITARWHLFQLHEYFTYALESLLHALLCELKKKDDGMSIDEFFKQIEGLSKPVSEKLMTASSSNVKQSLDLLVASFQLDEMSVDSSNKFEMRCNLNRNVSEKTVFNTLKDANEKSDIQQIIPNAIAILLLNYVRSYRLLSSVSPVVLWFNSRAAVELSPVYFVQEIRNKASSWSMDDLVRHCFRTIRDRHDAIALDKMFSGNDTFRFEEKGNFLKFRMDIYPNYPSQRSSKMDAVVPILEQLGLVEAKNKVKELTLDGEKMLGGV